jgi:hypothetical protein
VVRTVKYSQQFLLIDLILRDEVHSNRVPLVLIGRAFDRDPGTKEWYG